MTDEQIWEAIKANFTSDEARRMGLSLSLFAREIERCVTGKNAVALTEDVLMQAIADTTARGHVWASRALSNFRASQKVKS